MQLLLLLVARGGACAATICEKCYYVILSGRVIDDKIGEIINMTYNLTGSDDQIQEKYDIGNWQVLKYHGVEAVRSKPCSPVCSIYAA